MVNKHCVHVTGAHEERIRRPEHRKPQCQKSWACVHVADGGQAARASSQLCFLTDTITSRRDGSGFPFSPFGAMVL